RHAQPGGHRLRCLYRRGGNPGRRDAAPDPGPCGRGSSGRHLLLRCVRRSLLRRTGCGSGRRRQHRPAGCAVSGRHLPPCDGDPPAVGLPGGSHSGGAGGEDRQPHAAAVHRGGGPGGIGTPHRPDPAEHRCGRSLPPAGLCAVPGGGSAAREPAGPVSGGAGGRSGLYRRRGGLPDADSRHLCGRGSPRQGGPPADHRLRGRRCGGPGGLPLLCLTPGHLLKNPYRPLGVPGGLC
ncbi:ABC-type cobalt transport system, permease component CbiQ and related transporters, partial [Dysosmobacter welbionis]